MYPPEGSKDHLYAKPIERIGNFVFDDSVAQVFDDMIRRSVPGYGMTLSLMPLVAKRFGQPQTRAYDLGCSLGAGLASIANGLPDSVQLIGIDNAQHMLDRCAENLSATNLRQTWELVLLVLCKHFRQKIISVFGHQVDLRQWVMDYPQLLGRA